MAGIGFHVLSGSMVDQHLKKSLGRRTIYVKYGASSEKSRFLTTERYSVGGCVKLLMLKPHLSHSGEGRRLVKSFFQAMYLGLEHLGMLGIFADSY